LLLRLRFGAGGGSDAGDEKLKVSAERPTFLRANLVVRLASILKGEQKNSEVEEHGLRFGRRRYRLCPCRDSTLKGLDERSGVLTGLDQVGGTEQKLTRINSSRRGKKQGFQ
jgi:hypothetical protein